MAPSKRGGGEARSQRTLNETVRDDSNCNTIVQSEQSPRVKTSNASIFDQATHSKPSGVLNKNLRFVLPINQQANYRIQTDMPIRDNQLFTAHLEKINADYRVLTAQYAVLASLGMLRDEIFAETPPVVSADTQTP